MNKARRVRKVVPNKVALNKVSRAAKAIASGAVLEAQVAIAAREGTEVPAAPAAIAAMIEETAVKDAPEA